MTFDFGQMSQGFQSEFLSYVNRSNNAPSGVVARTTSRYGRPLGSSLCDRRSGYIDYAPAARKFPDNSPSGLADAGRKLSAREARQRAKDESWEPALQDGTVEQLVDSVPGSGCLKAQSGQAAFSSASFYRKDLRMKDRDHDDATSTLSDSASRTSDGDLDRRSRRRSPSTSLNGDDRRGRVKSASPAMNGMDERELRSSRSSPSPMVLDDRRRASVRRLSLEENEPVQNSMNSAILVKTELETQSECGQEDCSSEKNSLTGSGEKQSPPVETLLSQRPKRNIIPKNLEYAAGLSWREENDLKKALYASLQEPKRSSDDLGGDQYGGGLQASYKEYDLTKRKERRANRSWPPLFVDESSQESSKSGVSSENSADPKGQLRVRAQRKFAAGSRPGSPGMTPVKTKSSPRKHYTTKKAKTEDFLTFLCLRGSHVLPPHLDFSNIEDSDDGGHGSWPTTPRGSRPGTPALSGMGVRDLTPRGGRGAPTSRSTTPDQDICLDDNDLGVRPLKHELRSAYRHHHQPKSSTGSVHDTEPHDISPSSSPTKKAAACKTTAATVKQPLHLLSKPKAVSRSGSDHPPQEKKVKSGHGKDNKDQDLSPTRTRKEHSGKKKRSGEVVDGKVKKKKKKRREEVKQLRSMMKSAAKAVLNAKKSKGRRLVLRACNMAVKAEKRKQKLSQDTAQDGGLLEDEELDRKSKSTRRSAPCPLEVPPVIKRGVGRPRKVDIQAQQAELSGVRSKHKDRKSIRKSLKSRSRNTDEELTRTRSPETRSHTRSNSRALSPPKVLQTKLTSRSSDSKILDSITKSSKRDRSESSSRKARKKDKLRKSLEKRAGKSTRSGAKFYGAEYSTRGELCYDKLSSQEGQTLHRTRSLPDMKTTKASSNTQKRKTLSSLRRMAAAAKKTAKKMAAVTPVLPTEKKGRGRPPGTTKKSINLPKMSFREPFPSPQDPGRIVDIPTYHPSTEQFQDPISYIQSIRADAEPFGMCRIVPPDGWKPECKFPDDLKFVTQMQYIHRMYDRWGPNSLALECIRRHLEAQGIKLDQSPMIGGVELDLPALSETLQSFGGMQSVIDKNKWPKVIDTLHIPKLAPERCSKLYDSYCKYLLSYDTLPADEKQRLEQQVLTDKDKGRLDTNDDCVAKGRFRHLSDFFRHARNVESVWFKEEPTVEEVESLYWRLVEDGTHHVAVQSSEVDTKVCGSGFPIKKDSPYSRHGWNLNILQHNSGSVLRCLGSISGVTAPLLHVGMMFSSKCWSANDHLLPQIIYKHTGADTIWYCLPASEESKFHAACKELVPDQADDDPVWLLDDSVMLSPERLTEHNVSIGRTILSPGQFLIVFSEAFTASIATGYNLCESLHYATPDWIPLGAKAAQMLHDSGVPEQFSMDRLLFKLARSEKTPTDVLEYVLPQLELVVEREVRERQELIDVGLGASERMCLYDEDTATPSKKRHKYGTPDGEDNVCDRSKKICYLSMVLNEADDLVFSLEHALPHIQRKRNLKVCKMLYRYTVDEMYDIESSVRARLRGGADYNPPAKKKAVKTIKV